MRRQNSTGWGRPRMRQSLIITGDRAAQPRWSRNGRQIFYITADKKLMAADFDSLTATASAPRVLAQTRIVGAALTGFQYRRRARRPIHRQRID